MLDTVQIRRRGAQDFEAYYDNACAMQDSVPLPAVKANLSQGMLDFNGDRLKLTDWTPILNTLTINKQLQHVAVRSCYQIGLSIGEPDKYRSANRKKIPAIRSKEMTFKLCKALRECLTASPNLKTLQLHGLPFRERDLITLTKGLAKSVSLENLSLAHCPIADEGLEAICQSVKYSPSIKTHQAMRRHSAAWAESLRYRRPEFEGMGGLRRVTLNCNTLVGDRGAAALSQELAEDLWVKDNDLVKSVIKRVLMNANGQSSQYSWIKPPALKDSQKPPSLKRRILGNTARGKATFRIGCRRPVGGVQLLPSSHTPASAGVSHGALQNVLDDRGLPPGNTVAEQSFEGAATVKVTMETESEEEGEEEAVETKSPSALSLHERITVRQYRRVQVELEECRLRLAEERRARVKADTCLMEYELENARLRSINFSLSEALHAPATGPSCVLEDDAVLDSIESSFSKFHAFLDLLKDAGLGQLASMAGIDQSDFGPLGRPQLSSTVGRPLVGSGDQDTREKVDVAPSGGDSSSAPSEGQPNGCTPGAPATLRGFSPEGDLQEVPPVPASEFASEPCVEKPGGENQQRVPSPSQPEGRLVSGSEHSIHSNGSHGNDSYAEGSHSNDSQGSGSYGKGSRGRNVSHHSNGNGSKHSNGSNHSHGSHGYSFNYSNCSHAYSSIHSDGFHSNGWHVDGSVRSSLSDRSDRVESVGSFGLKASGGGRVGSGAQK
ncbi:unnamed protein product [Coregonus sp. 'balchen']|nr:unnamed protein product [Coregonus sp. 'balchen']